MTLEREVEILPPDSLVAREAAKLVTFFGEPVEVPPPPKALQKAYSNARRADIHVFSPHFLPGIRLEEASSYPGWKQRPHEWFWQELKEAELKRSAARLPGRWVLIDSSTVTASDFAQEDIPDDPFRHVVSDVIERKRDWRNRFIELGPRVRLDISANELDQLVFPQIAEVLQLDLSNAHVRSPRAIEYSFIGNVHHPEFGQQFHPIWFADRHKSGSRLISGHAKRGGIKGIDWRLPNMGYAGVSFRPMILFAP